MVCVTDNFGFKQEERFDCGAKAGDVFAGQRRFPQQMYWDYKVWFNKTEPKISDDPFLIRGTEFVPTKC